ncbi:MAG: hypothetical protein IPG76_17230 [Acidobacteria bacterium]|nr:hypothetical protein [Acidobacteriota bacterium]
MLSYRETGPWEHLATLGWVHQNHFTASIRGEVLDELVPARVTDAFGEMVIPDHPARSNLRW